DFSSATVTEVDECIDVSDTLYGALGTVCADEAPKTYQYSLMVGAHPDADVVLVCGDNTVDNVADFITNDTGATGDDDWSIDVNVSCPDACTLTQGYWKTHNDAFWGGAPSDETWQLLGPDAENTLFFSSG